MLQAIHIYLTNKFCSLVPGLSPHTNKTFSILQVMESWARPGNEAMNSVASTILFMHLQYPAAYESPGIFSLTKCHVTITPFSEKLGMCSKLADS